jgi:hypothetical protein
MRFVSSLFLSLTAAGVIGVLPGSGLALASDNCPRLESASLVIVIPEGGCDAADKESVLASAREVKVIRGAGRPTMAGVAVVGTELRAVARDYPGALVIVVDKRR